MTRRKEFNQRGDRNPKDYLDWYNDNAKQGDMVNANSKQVSGNHYKDMEVQPWEVMESILTYIEFVGFLKGNIIKYTMRAGKKENSDDMGKAKHYMEKLKEIEHDGLL